MPAYAPELNPEAHVWGHRKTHEIASLVTQRAWALRFEATAALRKMRRRPSVTASCHAQPDLRP
jgi:hypothetical protein